MYAGRRSRVLQFGSVVEWVVVEAAVEAEEEGGGWIGRGGVVNPLL